MTPYPPFVALVAGLAVSQWARTLPALAADGLSHDLALSPAALGLVTGLYHAGFALGQIPCGVALDRHGVRRTAIALLVVAVAGMALSAAAPNAAVFALAQFLTGLGCCGGLMCNLRWAAHALPAEKFGAASGYILALGSIGLMASGTPSAWIIAAWGWRGAYAVAALLALATLGLAAWLVRPTPTSERDRSVAADASQVLRLAVSRRLVPCAMLAFVGYAAFIGTRGLWIGPWLTEHLGLSLLRAGDALLLVSVAMAAGPALWGFLDSRLARHRILLLSGSHLLGGLLLLAVALLGLGAAADIALLTLFMLLTASHVLLFAVTRARVDEAILGKAMSAVNLAFFGGTAILQPLSGLAAGAFGLPGAIAMLGLGCMAGGLAFLLLAGKGERA